MYLFLWIFKIVYDKNPSLSSKSKNNYLIQCVELYHASFDLFQLESETIDWLDRRRKIERLKRATDEHTLISKLFCLLTRILVLFLSLLLVQACLVGWRQMIRLIAPRKRKCKPTLPAF